MTSPIASLKVLTVEQSDAVRDLVHGARDYWLPRGHAFYTLGTPSYLDLAENSQTGDYHRRAREHRLLLWERFGWLYDLVRDLLEQHLHAPVRYTEDFALPGFHIWLAAAVFTKPRASVHFDLQYRAFDWPDGADTAQLLSYTLPLRLPAAGGGLNTWDVTYVDFQQALSRGWVDGAGDLRRFHDVRYVPYAVGEVVVHSGHILHQVAPTSSVQPDDERLTFQGHGIWCADYWLLYW